jgi:hypothetical protein
LKASKKLCNIRATGGVNVKKIAQNVTIFGQYSRITLTVEKSCPTMWADSLILKKLAKVSNHPMGENSFNPVTLFAMLNTKRNDLKH